MTSHIASSELEFLKSSVEVVTNAPLYGVNAQCGFTGFPSPADDYLESSLDLNEYMNVKPAATFYVKASGQSMKDAGIDENDLLVVDRTLNPCHGRIAVCAVDGELVVKRIEYIEGKLYLISANPKFKPILLEEGNELMVWGVVRGVVKKLI